jgi:RecJ-like exonuclease
MPAVTKCPACNGRGYTIVPCAAWSPEVIELMKDPCEACAGTGEVEVPKCERCRGTGEVETQIGGDGYDDRCCALADVPCVCPDCDGTGRE